MRAAGLRRLPRCSGDRFRGRLGAAPEIAWLMGARGLRDFDEAGRAHGVGVAGVSIRRLRDHALRLGSWRSSHARGCRALGCPVSGAHGHADLPSIQCAIFGDAAIVDPGTHCYRDSRWRDFFRSTAAHSTIVVDGVSQVEPSRVRMESTAPRPSA